MADFALTAEQKEFRKWVHDFAEKEIRPVASEYVETEEFPWPVVKKAAEIGLYAFDFYMQVGQDDSGLMMPIALEESAWGCAGITLGIFGTGLPLAALAASGTAEQTLAWAPKMFGTPEQPALGAFCVTEANAGSDVSALRTTAKLERARSGQSSGKSGALSTFEATRPSVAAQAVGIAQASWEFARDYAKERTTFGRPIIEHQGVAFQLADMAMETEAARLLTWRAAWMARTGQPFVHAEGSMSKLKAGEVAVKVSEQAVQLLGGYGYIKDFPVEKWYRDSKIYTLFEGTSEIQRLVISRALAAE